MGINLKPKKFKYSMEMEQKHVLFSYFRKKKLQQLRFNCSVKELCHARPNLERKKPYTTTMEYRHSNERCFNIYFKYSTPQIFMLSKMHLLHAFFSICIKRIAWTHHIFWQRHTNAITKLWRHKFTCQNNDGNIWRERNVGKNTTKYAKLIHRKWLEVRCIVHFANNTAHFIHLETKI